MTIRTAVSRALLVLVLLFAVACGDDEELSAEDWADEVCTNAIEWQEDLEGLQSTLEEDLEDVDDIETVQEELVDAFDSAASSTEDLIEAIEDAGTPDVDDGTQTAEDFRDGFETIQGALEDARDEAEDIATDDPEEFQAEVQRIQDDFENDPALENAGDALEDIDPELDRAFDEVQSCKDFG